MLETPVVSHEAGTTEDPVASPDIEQDLADLEQPANVSHPPEDQSVNINIVLNVERINNVGFKNLPETVGHLLLELLDYYWSTFHLQVHLVKCHFSNTKPAQITCLLLLYIRFRECFL